MKKVETLSRRIEELRKDLKVVIEEEKELVNPKVVKASQSLDKVLIQYYSVLGMKIRRVLKEGVE